MTEGEAPETAREELIELLELCGCLDDEAIWTIALAFVARNVAGRPNLEVARMYLEEKGWMNHGVSIRCAFPNNAAAKARMIDVAHVLALELGRKPA